MKIIESFECAAVAGAQRPVLDLPPSTEPPPTHLPTTPLWNPVRES